MLNNAVGNPSLSIAPERELRLARPHSYSMYYPSWRRVLPQILTLKSWLRWQFKKLATNTQRTNTIHIDKEARKNENGCHI